jgi:hypothetical protein
MIESDPSTRRRLSDVEANDAALQRQLDYRIARPPVLGFHRDRWLGETVDNGQTYPETGNTFYVKLISAAFAPEAAGDSTVTSRDRGTIVLARTWPDVYLAEGTKVFVDRIKGVGEGGSWWIHANDPSGVEYAWLYGGNSDFTTLYGSGTLPIFGAATWSTELLANGLVPQTGLPIADGTALGNVGEAIGTRLKITKAGTYAVSAFANVFAASSALSGGGYSPMDWVVHLSLRRGIETLLRGSVSGAAHGPYDHWATPAIAGVVGINAGETLGCWLDGLSYVRPPGGRAVNWQLLLTRLDD